MYGFFILPNFSFFTVFLNKKTVFSRRNHRVFEEKSAFSSVKCLAGEGGEVRW